MSMWNEFGYYRPSVPRKAKGGIKAQTLSGQFGKSWWGRRWIQVLEGFDIGARLSRGRRYARSGQVLSIEIEKGIIRAKVQGSRPRPYEVEIRVKTLSDRTSKALVKTLATRAMFAAQLLRGEMPANIEEAFKGTGGTLFPKERGDLKTECSCPDWSNPCKHIAAVYYLLGEAFDNDPFLIFRMRGIERDRLLSQLRSAGAGKPVREGIEGAYQASASRRSPASSGLPRHIKPRPCPEQRSRVSLLRCLGNWGHSDSGEARNSFSRHSFRSIPLPRVLRGDVSQGSENDT